MVTAMMTIITYSIKETGNRRERAKTGSKDTATRVRHIRAKSNTTNAVTDDKRRRSERLMVRTLPKR